MPERETIGLCDDGHESLRYRLRTMSDRDPIQFDKAAKENSKNSA
jgi:hypothetical protein